MLPFFVFKNVKKSCFLQLAKGVNSMEKTTIREDIVKYRSEMTDRQILSVMTGITDEDKALAAADEILELCGGNIQCLPRLSHNELINLSGLTEKRVITLRASIEMAARISIGWERIYRITTADEACDFFRSKLGSKEQEVFALACLNAKNQVISYDEITCGTLTSSLVHPREIFKKAISANCAKIIVGHNHPSGDPTPSGEDKAVTKELLKAADILQIPLIDHIIVGGMSKRAISFGELGLLG